MTLGAVDTIERRPGAADLLLGATSASAPGSVTFQVTSRCNYECAHCFQTHDATAELSLAEIDRILGDVAEAGVLFLTLMGGEFFMRRDADAILRAARRHGFAVRLFTTGHHVDDRRANLIRDLGSIEVHLSVYSANHRVHDAFTATPGSWRRTMAAARRLLARGVLVSLKSPAMAANIDELHELAALARSVGASFLFDPKLTGREDGDAGPTRLRATSDQLRAHYSNESIGAWQELATRALPDRSSPTRPLGETPCRAGQAIAAINPRGEVQACNALPIACGDLRRKSFSEIWQTSPMLLRIRALTWEHIAECSRCPVRAYCSRCHAMALVEDGRLDGPALEACRHAVINRDLLRERGLIPPTETQLPPTWSRLTATTPLRGVRPVALRVLP